MIRKKNKPPLHITRCLWEAMLPQILLRKTSQTPEPLYEIPNPAFEKIEYFIRYQKAEQISIIKRKGGEKI